MVRVLMTVVLMGLAAGLTGAAEVKFALSGDNTKVTFVGTKPEGKHDGGFKKVTGAATVDGDPTTLKIAVDIDTDSLYSDDAKLTGHLKSPDFFGVKNNPTAKFATTKVEKGNDGGYAVTGNLTLNGKTKEVKFPAKIEAGADSLTLTSTFKINRNDWGISYGKGKIDDDVTIGVAIKAKK